MFATRIAGIVLLLGASHLPAARAAAVQQDPLAAGQRVRLDGNVGTVWATTPDSIVVLTVRERPGQTGATDTVRQAVARAKVRTLDVMREHGKAGTGAVLGLLVGAVAGGVIGSSTWKDPCAGAVGWEGMFCGLGETQNERSTAGALIGGLGGALLGAFIGSGITSSRWESVPLPSKAGVAVGVGTLPGDRLALGASVAF